MTPRGGSPNSGSFSLGNPTVPPPLLNPSDPPPAHSTPRWRFGAGTVLALLLFGVAYSNSLNNAFAFDDSHVIEQNLFIRDIGNIPRFFQDARTFSSLPQNSVYRPVVTTTLAVDYWLGRGLIPRQFHITQLILFALVGAMLLAFYRHLFDSTGEQRWHRWAALFAATLFCIHTGNSQVGNYISARSELLAALGVLGGFVMYMRGGQNVRRFHLYLIPVIIGALAKNHAVVFAPLLLCYKLLIDEQLSGRDLLARAVWPRVRRALVSSIPSFVVAVVLFVAIERMAPAGQTYGGGSRWQYLITECWVWVRYAGMYFVPASLTADTDLKLVAGADLRTIAGLALLIISIGIAWIASGSVRGRPIAFGILWFWLEIAPTSSIMPLAEVMNDHRPFLAFAGLNAAVIWAICIALTDAWPARARLRPFVVGGALALLLAHVIATHERNKVWLTGETLWADVATKSPKNARGLMNYAIKRMERGDLTGAKELMLRAHDIAPNYSFLETNLGIVENELGNIPAADAHFQRALALEPKQPSTYVFYARYLVSRGRAPAAIPGLLRSIDLSPASLDARHLLMAIYAAAGDSANLEAAAQGTLTVARTDETAIQYSAGASPLRAPVDDYKGWFALGWQFTQANRHMDAAIAYRTAIRRNPNVADAWNNLGWTLGKLGFFEAAVAPLERAIALRSNYPLAKNNLAWVRSQLSLAPPP